MKYASLPAMHRDVCRRLGNRTALRYKQHGLFHDISWSDYRLQADRAAAGLIQLGIEPGDRVAMLSENRFEWLVADHATQSTGAINVPMHAPLSPKQVQYQVGHSESRGVIVSGAEQAAKVFEVLDELPNVDFIISFDAIATHDTLPTYSWQGLQQRGWQAGTAGQQQIREREQALSADDVATIIYTSGTTGNPKGVMLTQGNLYSNTEATLDVSFVDADDIMLSWLPYSHIYARTVDHYVTTLCGMTLCLADSIDTLIVNLKELRPTWMTAVPRFYEKVWNAVEHLDDTTRTRELQSIFGPRIKQLSSGGAPLPRHVREGFLGAKLPMMEGYGLTESSPVISFNSLEKCRPGSVGQAIPGVEVRISDDGEILTRGPHVMKGYWKNAVATAETIVDGWLKTGDIGHLDDDGYLFITDRKKDLIITSGGKNIAPSELERLLISDPYIDQAVVYGDGRQFISAMIIPSQENLQQQAEDSGWSIEIVDEFIQTPAIHEFFETRIEEVMQAVSPPERVKKFLLMGRALQVDADELTATLKVRRRHIIAKYETQLSALYEN